MKIRNEGEIQLISIRFIVANMAEIKCLQECKQRGSDLHS